jgi:hypothetical protein
MDSTDCNSLLKLAIQYTLQGRNAELPKTMWDGINNETHGIPYKPKPSAYIRNVNR